MKGKRLAEALFDFAQRCFIGDWPRNGRGGTATAVDRLDGALELTPAEVARWDAPTQAGFAWLCREAITRLTLAPQHDPPGGGDGCTPMRLDAVAIAALVQLGAIVEGESTSRPSGVQD